MSTSPNGTKVPRTSALAQRTGSAKPSKCVPPKKPIRAFWFELAPNGKLRALVLRTNLPRAYSPTPASVARINRVAIDLTRSAFAPYICEPSNMTACGWVLHRSERTGQNV